ncbi:CHAT domain-containing protein [Streptomyces jietaisiensis]|uniref:CHAT domain-containing protein n=1 Tax=Streptomyces griseoaurantiacus TaxID=68213 RepID=UPI00324F58AB
MAPTPFDDEIARNRREAARGSVNAMHELAMLLRERHRYTGDPADLLTGIAQLRTALGYVPDHPVRPVLVASLSALLLDHFPYFRDPAALREALDGLEEALPLLDGENRFAAELMRADALLRLGETTRDRGPVDEAVEAASRLPRVPAALQVLGSALYVRYKVTHAHEDLVGAAAVLRECLRQTPADAPERVLRLGELGNVLQTSAEHTGEESLREEAVRYLRAVVEEVPETSAGMPWHKVDLAAALRDRGRHTGDVVALRESVALLEEALAAVPPGTGPWHNFCENHLTAVHSLVELTADVELLDRALEVGRAAYDAGGGAGGGAMVPLLLGQLHHVRYRHTLRPADLERAAALFGEVVGTTPYGGDDHVTALAGLGQVRFAEYLAGGDAEALRAAVVALGSTVRACSPDSPRRAEAQIAHGEALDAQYALGGDPGVLAAAGHAYREAARNEAVPPLTRVRAARAWALTEARAGNWRRARDTYALAVGLLPLVVPRRLARADQQRMLAELDGLASDAAAAALAAGDPEGAVLLLEQGRGLLGGQVLQGRDDLSRLRTVAPDLAGRLRETFDLLGPAGYLPNTAADVRHRLDRQLQELLDRARALPGFGDFLAAPRLADLLACAEDGPVVLINVSRFRGDALLVRSSGVTPVALPGVTPEAVAERAADFGAALTASTRPGPGEAEAQTVVTEVLGWLWEAIAEPVLAALGRTGAPEGDPPRLWWSPAGRLALLPLHAAGRFPRGPAVLDRVVSSYTPTLRALRHARTRHDQGGAAGPADGDLLVVTVGDAAGARTLRGVGREAQDIAALRPVTRLDGARATVDAVRAALTSHASVHIACHAASDPDDPSAGHLLLHDGRLSLLDLSGLELSGVRLAVLSACETSLGAPRIPDESLHLVSAFQLAGYPQVVGTLWQVNDRVARLVSVDLHRGLRAGEDVARALHHAVRRCRERFPGTPTLWAAYLHSGR